jgi:hypothetical protein
VDARGVLKGPDSRACQLSHDAAKAEIRYSEIEGAASVSVTIPIIILDRVVFSFDADKN